jgi:hypothetical protein
MNKEFHYYITFKIALAAGFKPTDAYTLAYASQYTDNNTKIFTVNKGKQGEYSNYISQTTDITKPEKELMRIYPIFHFMPATKEEIENNSALRRDGKFHILNTIPDNSNARAVFKNAIKSKDLYRIGIAAHMYTDTFAHQNFVGYYESFNAKMKGGVLEKIIPNVGHADLQHQPDLPALVWKDKRLIRKNASIDNTERFLQAAEALFVELRKYIDPRCPERTITKDKKSLRTEIKKLIGAKDKDNKKKDDRIARYKKSIGTDFKEYHENEWFKEAVARKLLLGLIRPSERYTWKPDYKKSNWYQFQEAVKAHQQFAKDTILDPITKDLELERL